MSKLFILLILISQICQAQIDDNLRTKLSILNQCNQTEFKLDSSGFNMLPTFGFECNSSEDELSWHVVDLNNDGLKDLIYSGLCKGYYSSAIFLNDGFNLNKINESAGKLIEVKLTDQESKIYFLRSSCCCDYYSEFIEVTIGNNDSIYTESIQYHFNTIISLKSNFKEGTISGILRSEPIENDSLRSDPCTDEKLLGNQILKIERKKVIIIDSKDGWNLVYYQNENSSSIIAWIRKE